MADKDAAAAAAASGDAAEGAAADPRASFSSGLFDEDKVQAQKSAYADSTPYKHGVIEELMADGLLRGVLEEIRTQIHFTEKATDIYRIWQSGDLANLDGLEAGALASLPSMLALRDALYSPAFRAYLSEVTGAGPLSGRKTDMAVNIYKPGCYLLCHDDVIGSRRVSYILYLTPEWRPEWGGALRLYATRDEADAASGRAVKVPVSWHRPGDSVPPAWNQLSFFAVQPGESYHDVEEVYGSGSAAGDAARTRVAISGWFHLPQEGEPGFVDGMAARLAKESSLAQLQRTDAQFDAPAPTPRPLPPLAAADGLSEADLDALVPFVSPQYLLPDAVDGLAAAFEADSAATLPCFLSKKFAERVGRAVAAAPDTVPHQVTGDSAASWDVAGPPHKQRFLYKAEPPEEALAELAALFRQPAFHKWLALVTGLALTSRDVRVRRFRRGYDYQLAQNYDEDQPRLETTLGVTPGAEQTAQGQWWVPPDAEDEDEEDEDDEDAAGEGDETHGTKRKRGASDASDASADAAGGRRGKKAKAEAAADDAAAMAEPQAGPAEEPYALETGGEEVYMAGDEPAGSEAAGSDEAPTEVAAEGSDGEDNPGGFRPASSAGSSDTAASPLSPVRRRGAATADTSFASATAAAAAPQPPPPAKPAPSGTGAAHARAAPSKADPAVYQAGGDDDEDPVLYSNAPEWNVLHLVLRDGGVLRFVKYLGRAAPRDRWDVAAEWGVEWDADDEDGADEAA